MQHANEGERDSSDTKDYQSPNVSQNEGIKSPAWLLTVSKIIVVNFSLLTTSSSHPWLSSSGSNKHKTEWPSESNKSK